MCQTSSAPTNAISPEEYQLETDPSCIQEPTLLQSPTFSLDDGFIHQYIPIENPHYFLPHAAEVYDRIKARHYMMKAIFKNNFVVPIQDPSTVPRRVLDIGCAAGTWCFDLATEYPHWSIVGMDILQCFPSTHQHPNVELIVKDATEPWPFPDASFDFVHVRVMILCFSLQEYAFVMKESMRVLKPGGYIQFAEADFQPWNCGPLYTEFLKECCDALSTRGFETFIVRHYHRLMTEAGFTDFHQPFVSVPVGKWGGVIGMVEYTTIKNPVRAFQSFFIEKSGLTPESWNERMEAAFTEVENHKGGYYNYHIAWAKKPIEGF